VEVSVQIEFGPPPDTVEDVSSIEIQGVCQLAEQSTNWVHVLLFLQMWRCRRLRGRAGIPLTYARAKALFTT
jgi:hypothetical protein